MTEMSFLGKLLYLFKILITLTCLALNKIHMFVCSSDGGLEDEEGSLIPKRRSASCPNPDVLALAVFNTSPAHSSSSGDQRESPSASVSTAPMRRTTTEEQDEEKEQELHLYAVSPSSRLYLHLQSSWSSYIIVSVSESVSTRFVCSGQHSFCI